MNPTHFDFELIDHVGHVILNRPTRLNALTFESYAELRDFFAHMKNRPDVRSIVIRGEGRAFCSGGDVENIIGELFARDMRGLLEFTRMTGALIENIRRTPSLSWHVFKALLLVQARSLRSRQISDWWDRGRSLVSSFRRWVFAVPIWGQLISFLRWSD